jgi:hypothetical protein
MANRCTITILLDGVQAWSADFTEAEIRKLIRELEDFAALVGREPSWIANLAVNRFADLTLFVDTTIDRDVLDWVIYVGLDHETLDPEHPGVHGDYVHIWDLAIVVKRSGGVMVAGLPRWPSGENLMRWTTPDGIDVPSSGR